MQNLIKDIIAAYFLEGIRSTAVALMVDNGTVNCMSPAQHNADRARGIQARMKRILPGATVNTKTVQLYTQGGVETQHVVVVALPS